MTDRELMQQALDVLEKLNKDGWILADFEDEVYASIEALRARLAQPEPEPINYEDWNYNPMTGEPLWGKQPEQEPVAWVCHSSATNEKHIVDFDQDDIDALPVGTMLYTAPPQREWQGLTDEQIQQIEMSASSKLSAIYLAEAQLKGKNAL